MTAAARSIVLFALLAAGCSKSNDGSGPAPSASASSAPAPSAHASAAPSASAASAGASASYGGSYTAAAKSIYIADSKEFASVKQAKDDPSKHVGEGTMTITIAPDGHVSGTIDSGPAAPAVIEGNTVQERITGAVRRKDPSDKGLSGTLNATKTPTGLEGVLVLSEAHAAIVREAKFSLNKK